MHETKVSIYWREDRSIFFMQYRDPISGNKVRKSTNTNRRREAERLAAKWEQ